MAVYTLKAQLLTRQAFAPFGDVVEIDGAEHFPINQGTVERYHDLAKVDVGEGGRTLVSIVESLSATSLPISVNLVERHPLGSQAFIPMDETAMCVVVAKASDDIIPENLHAFVSNGKQGVNYHRGTWHMPLVAFTRGKRFLVVDRGGAGDNCEERSFDMEIQVDADSILALTQLNP